VPCSLDSHRQGALMSSASASSTTGLNLSSIRDITTQLQRVFIVYHFNLITAKGTDLTLGGISYPAHFFILRLAKFLSWHLISSLNSSLYLKWDVLRLQFTNSSFLNPFLSAFLRKGSCCPLIEKYYSIGYYFGSETLLPILALPGTCS